MRLRGVTLKKNGNARRANKCGETVGNVIDGGKETHIATYLSALFNKISVPGLAISVAITAATSNQQHAAAHKDCNTRKISCSHNCQLC